MSVQTQIDRIEAAKEAIATAITGKGVTVPDGTLIDGMAALIDGIETGGGGGTSVAYGTFNLADTFTVSTNDSTTHNQELATITDLGFEPNDVYIICISTSDLGSKYISLTVGQKVFTAAAKINGVNFFAFTSFDSSKKTTDTFFVGESYGKIKCNSDGFSLYSGVYTLIYKGAVRYAWVAIG